MARSCLFLFYLVCALQLAKAHWHVTPGFLAVRSQPTTRMASAEASAAGKGAKESKPITDEEVETTLPPRYLRGCNNDRVEALRRWRLTLEWRRDEKIDDILTEAQPNFDVLKKTFPIYLYGRTKNNHVCLYEQVNVQVLYDAGLTDADLLRQYAFVTEVLWKVIEPDDDAQLVTVEDVAGVRLWHLTPIILRFTRAAAAMMAGHYVERCYRSYIINAPLAFRAVWRVVELFFDARTREKVRIIGYDHSQLLDDFDPSALPVEYGGTSPKALSDSNEELQVHAIVERNNAAAAVAAAAAARTAS
ncbi:unnamed protein product [Phaeothamnion confervicola]